jgi:hypothetical protein
METPTGLALLRKPFPPNLISKLPKPTAKRDVMEGLPKAMCDLCGQYHATSKVIHLDYVGHAALTDRLLDADPAWTWEPLAMTPEGLPVMDPFGGMWIKLTVCGVTRLGYGDAQGKEGGNAIKEVIGDALRNAAMRFGAALDLWHKGDLHGDDDREPMSESTIADWLAAIETAGTVGELRAVMQSATAAAKAQGDGAAEGRFLAAQAAKLPKAKKVPA